MARVLEYLSGAINPVTWRAAKMGRSLLVAFTAFWLALFEMLGLYHVGIKDVPAALREQPFDTTFNTGGLA
jgi:hypothetical protein